MAEAIFAGFQLLMDPVRLLFLFGGVLLGMGLGAIPGLSGAVGLAILLPFIYGMDPISAVAMLLGMLAVTVTADTIPAVMFAVPGTSSSAATVIDGYPMAKRGEASRAMGAAFLASVLGGIIGAIFLTVSVPISRPLLKQFQSPEFFMLCLLGVSMVGALSGSKPLRGIIIGGFGLVLAAIGATPGVGYLRFIFDQPYLFTGIPLLIVALGIFALPEVVDLFIKGTTIADVPRLGKGIIDGYKDTLRNWWLVLRCGSLGAFIGFIPGLGGVVANWIAYGHAVGSIKDGYFGKGDVRGVIAPESANNAKEGGALIPTLLFGVPGSAGMAVFLAGLLVLGIIPGPDMVEKNLPVLYSMMWSVVLANVIAGALCSAFARPIAIAAVTKVHYIIPFILMAVIVGAYQSTRDWGDLLCLFIFGLLGWIMKRTGWPRPPLLVGFVLGSLAEYYLYLSYSLHGLSWLYRPWVLSIGLVTIFSLIFLMRWRKPGKVRQ